jgi:hypothetical protein
VLPVKKYLTSYKTAQKIEPFCSRSISLEELHFLLSVCRRLTGVSKDLGPQIFSKFYLFYLKLYPNFFKIDRHSRGNQNTTKPACHVPEMAKYS